jgi:hypothetical protein
VSTQLPPPGSPPGTPSPGTPSPGTPPPGWPPAPPAASAQSGGTSGLAIASLVLGILWICGIGSLLAIIFGGVALGVTKGGRKAGRGFAVAGLVLGIIGVIATIATSIVVVRNADDIVNGTSGEYDDVTITNCERADDGHGVATLEITNDSSKASSYIVTVSFRPAGGKEDRSVDFKAVDRLDPDETTTVEVRSPDPVGGPLRCHLEYVNRFAFDIDTGS